MLNLLINTLIVNIISYTNRLFSCNITAEIRLKKFDLRTLSFSSIKDSTEFSYVQFSEKSIPNKNLTNN